jgi:ABC-type polysaccharide/polyol phosphate export permease
MGTTVSAMMTQMTESYSDIKTILYISAIGGGVCLLYCLYLVFLRSDATQQEYMYFYGFALVVLIVLAFLLGFLISDLSGTYNANRTLLNTNAACISDTNWQKVPRAIYA